MKAADVVIEKCNSGEYVLWLAGAVAALRGFPTDEENRLRYFRAVRQEDLAKMFELHAKWKNAEGELTKSLMAAYALGSPFQSADIESE